MWSKGDGRLVKLYPEHTYRDFSPNAAECMLGCVLVLILGFFVTLFDVDVGQSVLMAGTLLGVSTMVANMAHDLFRHLVLHPERLKNMRTNVSGWRWIAAIIEGAVIRVFSEWGRVVGLLERGEYNMLFMRFDWFCGVIGEAPKREEMWNNHTRAVLTVALMYCLLRLM